MKVNIVGLQHRSLSNDFIEKIGQSIISFKCETNNQYDRFAVQCLTNGVHFGYVEKENSQKVNSLISSSKQFTYKILSKDKYKVCLELVLKTSDEVSIIKNPTVAMRSEITIPNDANYSGVYRINFKIDGVSLSYIGQSTNISKRVQSHLKDLKSGTHHNKRLQNGWLRNPNSFHIDVLHKVLEYGSALDRQIDLFEKEIYFIGLEDGREVNSIDGDLVFTKESLVEFDSMNKEFKKIIKKIRTIENHKKEMLGKLILDLRIMDRVNKRLQYAEVKDTNVVTWLNKTRYSPLDYIPKIRYEVNGSKKLIQTIQNLNNQLKNISNDTVFVEDFKKSLFKKTNSYDTCNRKELMLYVEIMKKYQNGGFSDVDVSNYTVISNGRIRYDSSLLEIFDKSFLNSLVPFVG